VHFADQLTQYPPDYEGAVREEFFGMGFCSGTGNLAKQSARKKNRQAPSGTEIQLYDDDDDDYYPTSYDPLL